MKQAPFWVDDHPRPDGLTGELPDQTDYLVVGSGYTGLSAALRLAAAGKDVTVIDAGDIAGGASSVNGGFVSRDVKAGIDSVYAAYGPQIGHEMWRATERAVELVRDYAERPGINAVTHTGGMAALGRGSKDLKRFDRHAAWFRSKFNTNWEVVDARDIHTLVGGEAFNVALFDPDGFGVHPARLAFGLTREVHREGVRLVDGCRAIGLERSSSGMRVTTQQGAIEAGEVILATNGHTTRELSKELNRLLLSIGSYIIVTEPLGREAAEAIFPGGVVAWRHKRLLNYMRRTHDDRILIGGRKSLHTGLDLNESAEDLRDALLGYWPELESAAITHVWGGNLGVPFDLTPHIGRIDGAWYALGYAGHGVALSCQLGFELAGMLLGEDPPSAFSQIHHPARSYYSGRSDWFLTPVSTVYRFLDRLNIG